MDSSVAYIVEQTRQNVDFLISQRHISPADGRHILSKLPAAPGSLAALEQQTQNLLITPPSSTGPPSYSQPPAPQIVRAKALWGYQGQNPNDLSFNAGDTIEIVEETNSDWWTGRHNGRQGLFPSNYVEKPAPRAPSPYQGRDVYSSNTSMPSFPNQPAYQPPPGPSYQPPGGHPYQPPGGPPYQSPGGPPYQPTSPTGPYPGPGYPPSGGYQPAYQPAGPPPQGGQYNSYGGPPPLVPKPTEAQGAAAGPPPEPPKKGKFGKLGNTFAQSAVGGAGFGAGSAIGSGIVNSIF
ncbi:SH3-domain-containing protein [Mycena vitilis]|nr:SH3-domain-containing protein [Mycena vitilis]